jgi:hypothetical protein
MWMTNRGPRPPARRARAYQSARPGRSRPDTCPVQAGARRGHRADLRPAAGAATDRGRARRARRQTVGRARRARRQTVGRARRARPPVTRDELPAPAVRTGAGLRLHRHYHRLAPCAKPASTSTRTGSNGVIAATMRRTRIPIGDLLARPCRASTAARRSLRGCPIEPCGSRSVATPAYLPLIPGPPNPRTRRRDSPGDQPHQPSGITRGAIRPHPAASGWRCRAPRRISPSRSPSVMQGAPAPPFSAKARHGSPGMTRDSIPRDARGLGFPRWARWCVPTAQPGPAHPPTLAARPLSPAPGRARATSRRR